jgi:hypothetical protein
VRTRPAAWAAAALGSLALVRALVRRRARTPSVVEPPAPAGADPRAEELRRRLAESRELAGEQDEFERGETRVDEAEPLADPDVLRRGVHERGRAAVQDMRRSQSPE